MTNQANENDEHETEEGESSEPLNLEPPNYDLVKKSREPEDWETRDEEDQ